MPSTHRKNLIRDGDFMKSFSELIDNQVCWSAGQCLVGRDKGVIALSDAFDFTVTMTKSGSAAVSGGSPVMTTEAMAKMIRRAVTLPHSDDARKPMKPAPWRDLSDQVKAVFYHFAIRARGTSYRFDLNLSPDVADQARSKGSLAREFLRRRIAKTLKEASRSPVEFVLCLEEDGSKRLHVHGTLSTGENILETAEKKFREKVRAALKKAGGEWDGEGGQHQVNIHPRQRNPNLRGGTYIVKNVVWTSPSMRKVLQRIGDKKRLPSFQGCALTVTQGVRRDAEQLYRSARLLVIDFRKSSGKRS